MAFQILLEGQDITLYSDQMTIDAIDALGQGAGAGASPLPQGRAGTMQFDTSLGPINTAVGGGTTLIPTAFATDSFANRTNSVNWGNASDGQIWIENTPGISSVSGGKGRFIVPSGPQQNPVQLLPMWHVTDTEMLFRASLGNVSNVLVGYARIQDNTWLGHSYGVWLSNTGLSIISVTTGFTLNFLNSFGTSIAAGSLYWVRFRVQGTTLSAKVWLDGTSEPGWQVTAISSTYTAAGLVGFQGFIQGGTTATIDTFTATNLAPPVLVRMGELIIKDAGGNTIWGGFATKYTDISTSKNSIGNTKQNFTTINAVDYEAQLARIMVNEAYVAMTDVQIIKAVLAKYAPWVSLAALPATGFFVFPAKLFRNVSVLQVIQTVAGVTGYLVWIDFAKAIHYVSPATTSSAPFSLSDTPDFVRSYPHNVQEFIIDDNSAINRVTFYGGKKLSGDFTQDVSPLANSNNVVFPTAYYPHVTSDGKFHVLVNGSEKVVGFATGATSPANTFKSAGGLADVLINPDAHNFTFDVAPATGATVLIKFQYEFPLTVVVTDETAHKFFGDPYLDGSISDENVFDAATGVQRAKVLLSQQSFGQVSLKIDCWQPGIRSGQLLSVKNGLRGINAAYLVQQVETQPLGAGNFVYHLTLGAWHWNIIDVIVKLAASTAVVDNSQDENTSILALFQLAANVAATTSTVKHSETVGPYYARSAVVGDGHDSFPGFATIAS